MTLATDYQGPIPLARVVDHLSTALLLVDDRRRVAFLSAAAEGLLALSARRGAGATLDDLLPRASHCLAVIDRAAQRQEVLTERSVELRLSDGRSVEIDLTVTPVVDAGSHPGWLLVEMVDVERHHRISREEQLRAQTETARNVLRGLAHEIRNPLGGLRGAAQLLERELEEPGLREYTAVIIAEADRLHGLLDRMLGPRQAPSRTALNIHEVTERVCSLAEAEAPAGIRVQRDYDPSIPDLQGDYDLLIQALLNIVRNAVQAIETEPPASGEITVRTRVLRNVHLGASRHRLVVSVEVEDTGPGIPDHLHDSLFYPMVTGRAEGSGLGLSIAQSLVQQHGGLIECSSESRRTRFAILLPLDP